MKPQRPHDRHHAIADQLATYHDELTATAQDQKRLNEEHNRWLSGDDDEDEPFTHAGPPKRSGFLASLLTEEERERRQYELDYQARLIDELHAEEREAELRKAELDDYFTRHHYAFEEWT